MMRKYIISILIGYLIISVPAARAAIYDISRKDVQIVGDMQTIVVRPGDTLPHIARLFNVGYYELIEANPHINNPDHLKPNKRLIIPSRHILPDLPHKGIIINLAEMRLYYFLVASEQVMTIPIGIGRLGWATPTGSMRIVEKRANPTWFVPASIRKAREQEGVFLPRSVPPGPDNPLGRYAMRLSNRTYLIHGTNQPDGIGRRTTSGCIRLFPEDIADLFKRVAKGTRVRIIGEPYKVAWSEGQLYLEVHQPLQEHYPDDLLAEVTALIKRKLRGHPDAAVDWQKVAAIVQQQRGIPALISYFTQNSF